MNLRRFHHEHRTQLLVLIVIVSSVVGNVALSEGMRRGASETLAGGPGKYLRAVGHPWSIFGILVLVIWMIMELALLSRADLSFVLPVTSLSYVLIAIVGHFWLYERISWERWIGIVVITVGVFLAEETPERTTEEQPAERVP